MALPAWPTTQCFTPPSLRPGPILITSILLAQDLRATMNKKVLLTLASALSCLRRKEGQFLLFHYVKVSLKAAPPQHPHPSSPPRLPCPPVGGPHCSPPRASTMQAPQVLTIMFHSFQSHRALLQGTLILTRMCTNI